MSGLFERVAGPFGTPAGGVVWDGAAILFTVVRDSRIVRFEPGSSMSGDVRRFTNRTNGLALGPSGRLFGCQEGSRRIVELNGDGSAIPIVALLEGRRQNYPTDLTIDSKARIWLADPYNTVPSHGPQLFPVLPHASVLRLGRDPVTHDWAMTRLTSDTTAPRALLLSADEATLYVADGDQTSALSPELRAYPIGDDGRLAPYRLLHSFGSASAQQRGAEGLCLDADGNIIACAGSPQAGPGALIYVFSPTGRVIETFTFDEDTPIRCAFGGPDLTELYVTGLSGSLWCAKTTGHVGHRRKPASP